MKIALSFYCSLFLLTSLQSIAQSNSDQFEFSPTIAKPNARALMKEEFFWSPIDDSGPFGSDGGSDAAYGFHKWRQSNKTISPIVYLKELIASWRFPEIAWDEMDTTKIKKYMATPYIPSLSEIDRQVNLLKKENNRSSSAPGAKKLSDEQLRQIVTSSGNNMGISYLTDLDEAIIGTAFAQFVLEGKIDPDLKYYVTKALQREMLPILTRQFGQQDQVQAHNEKVIKLLQVVKKMPS
jgi:uncharacterized protein YfeS